MKKGEMSFTKRFPLGFRGNIFVLMSAVLTIMASLDFVITESVPNEFKESEWILRMEYKFGFKPPHLVSQDGTIPLWETAGHVIPSEDEIRLAASVQNQNGSMWTVRPFEGKNWQFDTAFRISGKGQTGTEGMAFWFLSDKSKTSTNFGGPDKWNGLAVILDSHDNDKRGNNPLTAAYLNNGTITYDANHDGERQFSAYHLYDYRNKPFPIHLRVRYYHNVLSFEMSDGMSGTPAFHTWGLIENVQLPNMGYFGLSASTGNINPDDHDVYSFVVHSIVPRDHAVQVDSFYRKQMDDYVKKAEEIHAAQMEYARQHPEKAHHMNYNNLADDQPMTMGVQQDLRNIYEAHSEIREVVKMIVSKLNEIVGRQESSSSIISKIADALGNSQQIINAKATNVQNGGSDLQRILKSQAELVESHRRLLKDVQDVLMRINQITQITQAMGNPGSNQMQSENWQRTLLEKVSILVNRKSTRETTNQSSNKLIWLVVILQAFTLIIALILIGRSDHTVKKFY